MLRIHRDVVAANTLCTVDFPLWAVRIAAQLSQSGARRLDIWYKVTASADWKVTIKVGQRAHTGRPTV